MSYPFPIPSNRKYTIIGILLSLVILAALSISLYRARLRRNLLPPINSKGLVSPSPDPTTTWESYTYSGLILKHPSEWDELEGKCQALFISKSDAIELEKPLSEYVVTNFFNGDVATYEDTLKNIVDTTNNRLDLSLNFPHILANDLVILGPLGEGEINNIIIRGPEGTGYFHIVVRYSGPIPDKRKVCLEEKKSEYKEVLSTLQFGSSGAKLNEPCAGANNIVCEPGLVCNLQAPSQISPTGVCIQESIPRP